jgi:uncharacterized protein (TIGR00369 family)
MESTPTDAGRDRFLDDWADFYEAIPQDIALTLGLRPVRGDDESVVLRMPHSPSVGQPMGLFSAAALIGLADVASTHLCRRSLPAGAFPYAIQVSANLVANVREGDAIATSRLLKAGRAVCVAQALVHAEDGTLLASVVTTYVAR